MKKSLRWLINVLAISGYAIAFWFWFMPVSYEHFMLAASGLLERFI